MIRQNEQVRLAKMEAICNQLRAEMDDVLHHAYEVAVEENDVERAAELARKIRNKLLQISDSVFVFDRFGLVIPENITATSLLSVVKSFFTGLGTMLNGAWAVYRRNLRDLPDQQGFPFNIEWPEIPRDND